jgi:uncharacterized membrane protein
MQATIEVVWWSEKWSVAGSAWPLLGSALVLALFVYAMSRDAIKSRWPVNAHREEYTLTSVAPLVVILFVGIWITNWTHNGSASPLPYIPILNPLEVAFVMTLFGIVSWWQSVRDKDEFAGAVPAFNWLIRGTAFVVLTGGIIRACHHYANIPWRFEQLFESNVVQTSLSIVWGIVAISMMLLGNRRQKRPIWFTGASLVGIVVIKLFVVELSASGSLERIVSFIVVGLLLLFVGYVAPLPPRQANPEESRAEAP